MRYFRHPSQTGFTMLELAVVLAVIGLLAGGILLTQSYIRTSGLTTMVNEGKYYLGAMKQFERVYGGAVAGDMGDATARWSTAAGNGNGNGVIYQGDSNPAEIFYAFQYLQLAGLIPGSYTGLTGSANTTDGEPGTNLPNLSLSNVSVYFTSASTTGYASGDTYLYDGSYGSYYLTVGQAVTDALPRGGFLTPQEAYELDNKFDNGIAGTGWMRSFNNTIRPNCATGTAYNVATSSPADACNFVFTQQ